MGAEMGVTEYYVDLQEYSFELEMPIIQWCLDNNICREQCLDLLQFSADWRMSPRRCLDETNLVLQLDEPQALLFCLKWGAIVGSD